MLDLGSKFLIKEDKMVCIHIKGGMGNQLFQYATAYSLAKRLNQELAIDLSFFPKQDLRSYKLKYLKIQEHEVCNNHISLGVDVYNNRYVNKVIRKAHISHLYAGRNITYCFETGSRIMPWFFYINRSNLYLDGYYQSEDYFKNYRQEIIKQFTPAYIQGEEYLEYKSQLESLNSVAVHVRRGDFLKAQYNYNPHHYLLGEGYYRRAMSYIESKVGVPHYFWFSDDIEWVKKSFGNRNNFHYVTMHTENPDIDEMMLMKSCKHIISANSTFSWWAAWLNESPNAIITVPEKRYGNEKMIPERWVKLSID